MTFHQVDSVEHHNESGRLDCLPAVGGYRECTLRSYETRELHTAVVDASGRVVLFTQKFPPRGGSIRAEYLTQRWNKIATSRDGIWRSKDRRWTAQIVRDSGVFIVVADAPAAREYAKTHNEVLADSVSMAQVESHSDAQLDRLRDALDSLVPIQDDFRRTRDRFAANFRELHRSIEAPFALRIIAAGDRGWWAEARVVGRDDVACYVWQGTSPRNISPRVRAGSDRGKAFCRPADKLQPVAAPTPAPPHLELGRCTRPKPIARLPHLADGAWTEVGVFETAERSVSGRPLRKLILRQAGDRWAGRIELEVGEATPLVAEFDDGARTRFSDIQFVARYADGFADHVHATFDPAPRQLSGRLTTQDPNCGTLLNQSAVSWRYSDGGM